MEFTMLLSVALNELERIKHQLEFKREKLTVHEENVVGVLITVTYTQLLKY